MSDASLRAARRALARSIGLQAYLYGLPLVEMMRTCTVMTSDGVARASGRAALNQFGHAERRWTHLDRDVVTPANDLLYSMAWLDLRAQPVLLGVPGESRRYWVMALLDAWTNNFVNIGPRTTGGAPARYLIASPDWRGEVPEDAQLVPSPSPLVWIIGRVLVDDDRDLPAAREMQQRFTLAPLPVDGRLSPAAHPAPTAWPHVPDSDNPLAFFDCLARGLAENPPPASDAGLVASFSPAGIRPGLAVTPELLDADTVGGLLLGLADGVAVIDAHTRSRRANPWSVNYRLGRFGTDWLGRACTAAKGLGGVVAEEALYAMSDFDAAGDPLSGEHRYRLHFGPGDEPPVDGFWSISLYGEDRFFIANPIARHAIGDRTRGLHRESDGSLLIQIQNLEPAEGPSNWLPAPSGPFYLILRMYHPRETALRRGYRIPPLTRID